MKLPSLLSFLLRRRAVAMPPVLSALPQDSDLPMDEEPPLRSCGWFDSSHDLHQGLRVQEHSSAETLAHEWPDLPLVPWLELQLSGWRATALA